LWSDWAVGSWRGAGGSCPDGTGTLHLAPTTTTGTENMIELLGFISYLITLYTYVVIASVVISWLIGFGVINAHNQTVRAIAHAIDALTEPFLRPIRRMMPNLGAIDISPIVLLLICFFIQSVLLPNIAKLV
jgi:YggT family protein